MTAYFNFNHACESLRILFEQRSKKVVTETWQSLDVSSKPEMATYELLNETVAVDLSKSYVPTPIGLPSNRLGRLKRDIQPNIPWADDHFAERIGGKPLNPPPSEAWWPHAKDNSRFKDEHGQFSHTYPERYWARHAAIASSHDHWGIRYRYGDLNDLIDLLRREPNTRQAYLPIFFPEDTGAVSRQRIPCSLGYHFILRGEKLHIVYYLRSCDFANHFRDDVYLTVRLLLWVTEQLKAKDMRWSNVTHGTYTMHITSLHLFMNDYIKLIGAPP